MTPKPPPLLVFNEPEASLHPGLLLPLADLMAKVPHETQIIVVTHSQSLADALEESCEAKRVELVRFKDETRRAQDAPGPAGEDGPKRVWTFDD